MESGALKHLIRTAAGCALFFGLVAPPLGGVLMFLLMAFGSGEWVGISLLDAGDLLGMAGFIGIFFLCARFFAGMFGGGYCRYRPFRHSPIAVVSAVVCGGFRHCSRFAECRSAYFWRDRGLTGNVRRVFMVASKIA